jgi:hypothetical protein
MDATTVQITRSGNGSTRRRASPRRHKPAPMPATPSREIAIALDVEQLVYEVNTLLNAASLINRISKG